MFQKLRVAAVQRHDGKDKHMSGRDGGKNVGNWLLDVGCGAPFPFPSVMVALPTLPLLVGMRDILRLRGFRIVLLVVAGDDVEFEFAERRDVQREAVHLAGLAEVGRVGGQEGDAAGVVGQGAPRFFAVAVRDGPAEVSGKGLGGGLEGGHVACTGPAKIRLI